MLFLKGADDSEKFLVVDLIVVLLGRYLLREEGDGV